MNAEGFGELTSDDMAQSPELDPGPALPSGRDFERGVEFGLLYARVQDYGHVQWCVHADMAELVMRLAEDRNLPFGAAPHEHDADCRECVGRLDCKDGEDWLDVTIGPAPG